MMISCRRFADLVVSGELDESGWLTRLQAGQHRLQTPDEDRTDSWRMDA
jgi:hypothetical protein